MYEAGKTRHYAIGGRRKLKEAGKQRLNRGFFAGRSYIRRNQDKRTDKDMNWASSQAGGRQKAAAQQTDSTQELWHIGLRDLTTTFREFLTAS
ncbi:hypothetical protein NEUTE1DRAFT_98281 [Neurospora tetrasperma FGSC 2508]|uniref:Uncharacterized protein n=1 Tax=Neurospora tetrasperma (strain FGSC 2508 / ATCC MYA-4615 / P0657) TaxID=510951 RepID=F8MBM8_NEUT8|nr:uncharacterized protein NEUTE1DRAFT_98281 [Neurospora tetrasperma FGSC 2508]EGO61140.1 hypothetical protein NEUTE1DRAFT_98281 [Neurospora tetrasperma FGSC 2508]